MKCDFCDTPCGNDWCPSREKEQEVRMSLVEDKLNDLYIALHAEFNTEEPPVLFLDEKSYYALVSEMRKRAINDSDGAGGGHHFGITIRTPYGFDAKIFNKNELYSLTNVINRICANE